MVENLDDAELRGRLNVTEMFIPCIRDRVLGVDHAWIGGSPEDRKQMANWQRIVDTGAPEGHRAVEAAADFDPK